MSRSELQYADNDWTWLLFNICYDVILLDETMCFQGSTDENLM